MGNPYDDAKRVKFIDHADLMKAANMIGDKTARGEKRALVGGFALQLLGSPRLTGDLDVLGPPVPSLKTVGSLRFHGTPGGVSAITPNGVPVDFIDRRDDYEALYQEALDNTTMVMGLSLPVVDPPYIAAMKMEANRSKDHADLEWMIANGRLDTGATRKVIHKHLGAFAAQEFDAFVAVVIWKKSEDLI